ncbi:phosphoribosyltransferase [Gordonia neofelifaecis]|uniref:Phosphoribosyltransferase n=1 Tax=Gordonia neofelifaecis NRRL B-59395 TaxID=644548 RepID=F1YDW7_9ACTN|nr:phosphoribosyltransferase family protein [Gordonia neofelifaecis]EGD57057.1 phosphoribosyltransferase [Gordonia neofelifaecis NRRL B-59395]
METVIARVFPARRYRDREHAGEVLAEALTDFRSDDDVLVLALPRGGVEVAAPVAERLDAPLDVCLVHKLGVPWEPELAVGAIAVDDSVVVNDDVVRATGTTEDDLTTAIDSARIELRRRDRLYRHGRPQPSVTGRRVVIVDDGVATGTTVTVAIRSLRSRGAERVVVAVPVGPADVGTMFPGADSVVCPYTPDRFSGVGSAYYDFRQLTDERVVDVLSRLPPE